MIKTEEKFTDRQFSLCAAMSQDLKTPVRAQFIALNLMLGEKYGKLTKAQKNVLNELIASNSHLEIMLENFLYRNIDETCKISIFKSENDIKKTIRATIEKLYFILLSQNQKIVLNFDETPCVFAYDAHEIARVFVNLVLNACERSAENSTLQISINEFNDYIELEFEDNGYGIMQENPNEIFEKFATSKRIRNLGMGISLYICKRIVLEHDGQIYVKKTSEHGTVIVFTLPKK